VCAVRQRWSAVNTDVSGELLERIQGCEGFPVDSDRLRKVDFSTSRYFRGLWSTSTRQVGAQSRLLSTLLDFCNLQLSRLLEGSLI